MATQRPLITPTDRFGLTLCIAILAHGILVLGVTFSPDDLPKQRFQTMEITLVRQESLEAMEDAKVLAQANLQGGGDLIEEDQIPSITAPAPFPKETPETTSTPVAEAPAVAQAAPAAVEITTETPVKTSLETKSLAVESTEPEQTFSEIADQSTEKTEALQEPTKEQGLSKNTPEERKIPETKPLPKPPSALSLMTNSLEIASLSARIERKLQQKASRPRKKFISANTKESKYAFYMKSWSDKVERIGNLNYPDAARKKKLSGSLRLDVALNNDGSIQQIVVTQSSGHSILDQAAIRIVKLAAPYAPFPAKIKAETDILHIIRTWRFVNGERFQ